MRSGHIATFSAGILTAILLLGATMAVALDETQSVQRVAGIASVAQTLEGSWFFDDDLAEALVSEAIVLLLCAVGCGLLVAGMEGFDLWRERRVDGEMFRRDGSGCPLGGGSCVDSAGSASLSC